MRSGPSIRSELVANRENRPARRRHAEKMAFGIYRPLSEESVRALQAVLSRAKVRADDHFAGQGGLNKYTELIIPKDHGVTYVRRDQVRKALKTSIMKNFSLARAQTTIADYNYRREEVPPVPVDQLDWFGKGRLKLVGRFAMANAEAQELAKDSEKIGLLLERAGGTRLDVYEPDHVTLCRFRRAGRGHELDENQRSEVKAIVQEEMVAAHIGSVSLAEVVVGNGSYRQPLPVLT